MQLMANQQKSMEGLESWFLINGNLKDKKVFDLIEIKIEQRAANNGNEGPGNTCVKDERM